VAAWLEASGRILANTKVTLASHARRDHPRLKNLSSNRGRHAALETLRLVPETTPAKLSARNLGRIQKLTKKNYPTLAALRARLKA
jgi:hypothetical protein